MSIGIGIAILIMLAYLCLMVKVLTEMALNLATMTPQEKGAYFARLRAARQGLMRVYPKR